MSGTIRRGRTRARIVITLDVEVSDTYLQTVPTYRRDAISVLRSMVDTCITSSVLLRTLHTHGKRKRPEIVVLEEKVEVCG